MLLPDVDHLINSNILLHLVLSFEQFGDLQVDITAQRAYIGAGIAFAFGYAFRPFRCVFLSI